MNRYDDIPKNKMGRPTKFTPELAVIVIEKIRRNLSFANAARFIGVEHTTVIDWYNKGKEEKEKGNDNGWVNFYTDVRKAQAGKIEEMLDKIESMPKAWQAVSWLLEKCCADEFGKESELYKQLLEDYKMLMQSLIDNQKGK